MVGNNKDGVIYYAQMAILPDPRWQYDRPLLTDPLLPRHNKYKVINFIFRSW